MTTLFEKPLNVISLGLSSFADNLREAGGDVLHLNWKPVAEGDAQANWQLATLLNDPRVNAANEQAIARYLEAQPELVGVSTARAAIPALNGQKRILHSGPPIAWQEMCGPVQGAIAGAIVYEGWASDVDQAMAMAARGDIALVAVPSLRRGRANGGDYQPVDAGMGGGKPHPRQPHLL